MDAVTHSAAPAAVQPPDSEDDCYISLLWAHTTWRSSGPDVVTISISSA